MGKFQTCSFEKLSVYVYIGGLGSRLFQYNFFHVTFILLVCSFFTAADGVPAGEKPYIKVSSKLKEVIRRHCENSELRLREEQKKLAQQRRVSKAQESIMSEDEKKKRRKMRKVSE